GWSGSRGTMATWSSRGCVSVMVIIFVYLENIKKPATNPLGLMAGLKLVFCATASLHADSPSPDRLSLGERAVIIIVAILAATHAGQEDKCPRRTRQERFEPRIFAD